MDEPSERTDADEIEITPEMVNAGVGSLMNSDRRVEDPDEIVIRIFQDMLSVRR